MSDGEVVAVGARMRFSLELMKEFYERSRHHSPIVEVVRIDRAPDGTLTVWLKAADRQESTT